MSLKIMFRAFSWFALILLLAGCADPTPAAAELATKSPPAGLENGAQEVGGIVLGGGDTTPEGLMDAPRTFIYQIKLESGEEISVRYVAYPPSPAGDTQPKIKLTFHAGEIKIGDYMLARGVYDPSSKTLTVENEGDFIQTTADKP